jgi:hypothetical protein
VLLVVLLVFKWFKMALCKGGLHEAYQQNKFRLQILPLQRFSHYGAHACRVCWSFCFGRHGRHLQTIEPRLCIVLCVYVFVATWRNDVWWSQASVVVFWHSHLFPAPNHFITCEEEFPVWKLCSSGQGCFPCKQIRYFNFLKLEGRMFH